MKVKEESEKAGLKLNIQKTKIMASGPISSWQRDGNTRLPELPPEKPLCRSRINSRNLTWNKRLVPSWERSISRLYTVTLLI